MSNCGCPCGEPERFYESFTFFQSAKEYRSKTGVTLIEKTNTNVTCNNCQAKYDDSKCKTTDLLQAMTCIALKQIDMKRNCISDAHFEMQRTERVIHNMLRTAIQYMLESFRATPE